MGKENKVDLGSIQIHKKVLEDIVYAAIKETESVRLAAPDFSHSIVAGVLGKANHPGINISIDKSNQVKINVGVVVKYGMKIPEVARHAQDAIRSAIDKTVDIDLKEINVNIQGIERGDK